MSSNGGALVDIIVPVHTASRPVDRLAESVLTTNTSPLRLIFACHNVDPGLVSRKLGGWALDARVVLIPYFDSTRGPAGPFNHALGEVRAPFVSKIDSDDTIEPGAIDAWLRTQARTGADIVIPRMITEETRADIPTPPLRIGRRANLDAVRDRLAYRTSTMGLVSAHLLDQARATPELETGEDILPSLKLWFSDAVIAFAASDPAYVVHDGADRVTSIPRSLDDELAFLPLVLNDPWFAALTAAARRSIAIKLLRIQLFGTVSNRPDPEVWNDHDRASLRDATRSLLRNVDGIDLALSIAETRMTAAMLDTGVPNAELVRRARARRRFGSLATLLPQHALRAFDREAPWRLLPAFWYASRRFRRVESPSRDS